MRFGDRAVARAGGCESKSGSSGGFGVGKGMLGGVGVRSWVVWEGDDMMRVEIGIDGVIWLVVWGVGGVGGGERV